MNTTVSIVCSKCGKPIKEPSYTLDIISSEIICSTCANYAYYVNIPTGWICPICQQVWAPWVLSCNCRGDINVATNQQTPDDKE